MADNSEVVLEQPKGEISISVRQLVEFILRSGDIDNRHQHAPDQAMKEGSRIHRMIQKRMGPEYQAEVSLKWAYETARYMLVVEGRADGIVDQPDHTAMIDEIKGTYRDLEKLRSPIPVHVAQAKCYAYMYANMKGIDEICVRLTYCNIETEDIRYFYEDFTFEQLEKWFMGLVEEYRKWADYSFEWRNLRQKTLEQLEFPFPYREGQRDLVTYVYQSIYHKKKLFIEAPTGVGKTISTVFPALKAMGKGMGEKLFYLTAKTITRSVADDTIVLLRQKGLAFKSVILTAKEKICFMEEMECNPEHCPYAKGHYDRINEAIFDLMINEDSFSREKIEAYAVKHQVCPFEMTLDMSLFADGIICDYNYLFDPHVYLKRFFAEGNGGEYIFLIDEAHNLLDRGREMYSASLLKETFLELKKEVAETIDAELTEPKMDEKEGENQLVTQQLTLEMTGVSVAEKPKNKGKKRGKGGKSIFVREGYASKLIHQLELCNKEMLALKRECDHFALVDSIEKLVNVLLRLYNTCADYMEEQEEVKLPVRESLLDFYFDLSHFLEMYERLDENYVKYSQIGDDGKFLLKLFCVNPRENLKECMQKGRSSILFSATFLPIQYYKELLGGEAADYEVYAKSVFHPEKKGLYIATDVTSKYTRRSEQEYYNIAKYISEIVTARSGNYMVFCPSYSFMKSVYGFYEEYFEREDQECLLQQEYMSETDREEFLARFRGNESLNFEGLIDMDVEIDEEEHTLIGFCVLGGIFGEGIDLKNDSLIGAIIVGTGLPLVCNEREILKNYFDERGENGFDYAYRYPGMNKVLQAAGRVIRTAEDIGVVALLDERFMQATYRRMYPREWNSYEAVNVDNVAGKIERFWDSWHKYS